MRTWAMAIAFADCGRGRGQAYGFGDFCRVHCLYRLLPALNLELWPLRARQHAGLEFRRRSGSKAPGGPDLEKRLVK